MVRAAETRAFYFFSWPPSLGYPDLKAMAKFAGICQDGGSEMVSTPAGPDQPWGAELGMTASGVKAAVGAIPHQGVPE
jgi:hypothetical protein